MMKKLVFVSNFMNHHQKVLAEEFRRIYGSDYVFIAFTPFDSDRLAIGYRDMNQESYVLRAYESPEAMSEAMKIINEAECVIIGALPVSVISRRLQSGKITFMYSERFFKGPLWKDAVRFVKYCIYSGGRFQAKDPRSKFYLLCAGAFAAWDYNTCGLFRNKAYRWGYFPEPRKYDDIDGLMSRKKESMQIMGRQISRIEASGFGREKKAASCGQADFSNGSKKYIKNENLSKKKKCSVLWAGRFLEWKHPDLAVSLAANLRDMNLDFSMKIIGSGVMQEKLAGMIESLGLSDIVELTGAIPTEELRAEMENSQIFLFTSDRGEGWGAVLNESMNSGCAVVAGEKIGSVPYLIKDGHNGLVFRDRDIDDLTAKVAGLLRNPERADELGRNAYETMTEIWTPRNAAERFVRLAEALRNSDEPVSLWEDGPGSIAPVI